MLLFHPMEYRVSRFVEGSVDNGGHSLRTEKIFVGKTSSGFPEDINREDEVTLTSVSCVRKNKLGAGK